MACSGYGVDFQALIALPRQAKGTIHSKGNSHAVSVKGLATTRCGGGESVCATTTEKKIEVGKKHTRSPKSRSEQTSSFSATEERILREKEKVSPGGCREWLTTSLLNRDEGGQTFWHIIPHGRLTSESIF